MSASHPRLEMILYPDLRRGVVRACPRPRTSAASVIDPPERDAQRSKMEAVRRARAAVERIMLAHRLSDLVTLTYSSTGCHNLDQVGTDIAAALRSYRRIVEEKVIYVATRELHESGHGWHAMIALNGVDLAAMDGAWRHGAVDHDEARRDHLITEFGEDGAIGRLANYI